MFYKITKIYNFRVDLTDISAEKEPLCSVRNGREDMSHTGMFVLFRSGCEHNVLDNAVQWQLSGDLLNHPHMYLAITKHGITNLAHK